ncbi:type-F conjugative transfer system protein TraW [Pseudomonas lundensis]|uniref:type-F conjugative transfer system protein TraW n=1 Tax=Pseudomonas lundensis TaxID=86185 RepID=UPI001474DD32|nr:type-F conjugative transfer system protein TraW [Pseudomonas lundensis]NNA16321.1 type-F conjugative transfer system protein TraW [Pseudomonas lundensis]
MKRLIPYLLSCLCTITATQASDLEALGPVYPIQEQDLLQQIEQRLRAQQRSGELARRQRAAAERARAQLQQPAAVAGVRTTQTPRRFHFDPSITLDRPLLGARGEVLFAAGSRHNPLDIVALSQPLLFFDARDARQVKQARTLLDQHRGQLKPILTGGAYLELMRRWQTSVYFDQHGRLTRRLGITHVPALVSQDGARLRIDELQVLP